MVKELFLFIVLTIAVGWDLKKGLLPNPFLFGAFFFGIGLNYGLEGWGGVGRCLAGALIAACAFWPGFRQHLVGGGDVKLAMVVGVFVGYPQIITTLFWIALSGGIFALIFLWRHRALAHTFQWLRLLLLAREVFPHPLSKPCAFGLPVLSASIPYAPVITCGVLAAFLI